MIVNDITQKIGKFLKDSDANLSELSRKTGIPYNLLYASVWDKNRERDLRVSYNQDFVRRGGRKNNEIL